MTIRLVFCFLLVTIACLKASAATINSAGVDYASVSNAVASAQVGDTVVLPAGSNYWTGTINISGITLIGAGTNSTYVVDETPITGSGLPLINITTTSALSRVAKISFTVGVTNSYPAVSVQGGNGAAATRGNINVFGTGPLRIDDCRFHWLTGKPVLFGNQNNGVVDHCSFEMYAGANAVEINGNNYGDDSWASPYIYGTNAATFIEDCYISSAFSFAAIDVSNGARAVIRHCNFSGTFINNHGTETAQRFRSCRVMEIYNNTMVFGPIFNNFSTAITIRGGSALIFSNDVTSYYALATLQDFRSTDNDPGFTPWFGATGLMGYDNNGLTLAGGTASATSNLLYVASANWTPNQWTGYTVYNSNSVNGVKVMGLVSGNDTKTISFFGSRNAAYQVYFTNGDAFAIRNVYPKLDMPGRGQGDLLTGDTPAAVWSNEGSEPIYDWANTQSLNGGSQSPPLIGTQPDIILGRDYTNTAKVGYTPYTYPHPLTLPPAPPANSFTFGAFKL